MKNILITGAGSYVGESVRDYILANGSGDFSIDTVDTFRDEWRKSDFRKYDVIFHVAGIAHVNADPKMEPLYYKVNRDLALDVARHARKCGVRQFIFMSSQIVFHESKTLKPEILTIDTQENPNGFYGDSKLQAEKGLQALEEETFKVCILRPPMIYGVNSKGNFPRLIDLAHRTPIFPMYHNKRSMLYIDNLAEFVKQAVLHNLSGIFYPQNAELSDTLEIIKFFAKKCGHKIWISSIFNPCVYIGSHFIQSINKMFGTYYYDPDMSKMKFDYQLVTLEESLERIAQSLNNH